MLSKIIDKLSSFQNPFLAPSTTFEARFLNTTKGMDFFKIVEFLNSVKASLECSAAIHIVLHQSKYFPDLCRFGFDASILITFDGFDEDKSNVLNQALKKVEFSASNVGLNTFSVCGPNVSPLKLFSNPSSVYWEQQEVSDDVYAFEYYKGENEADLRLQVLSFVFDKSTNSDGNWANIIKTNFFLNSSETRVKSKSFKNAIADISRLALTKSTVFGMHQRLNSIAFSLENANSSLHQAEPDDRAPLWTFASARGGHAFTLNRAGAGRLGIITSDTLEESCVLAESIAKQNNGVVLRLKEPKNTKLSNTTSIKNLKLFDFSVYTSGADALAAVEHFFETFRDTDFELRHRLLVRNAIEAADEEFEATNPEAWLYHITQQQNCPAVPLHYYHEVIAELSQDLFKNAFSKENPDVYEKAERHNNNLNIEVFPDTSKGIRLLLHYLSLLEVQLRQKLVTTLIIEAPLLKQVSTRAMENFLRSIRRMGRIDVLICADEEDISCEYLDLQMYGLYTYSFFFKKAETLAVVNEWAMFTYGATFKSLQPALAPGEYMFLMSDTYSSVWKGGTVKSVPL